MGILGTDLRAVATRLSTSLSTFATLRNEVRSIPGPSLKYDRRVDWLNTRPIVDLERNGPGEYLLVPSPWKLLAALADFVLYEFVLFLNDRKDEALGGRDGFSLRGEAFATYLRKYLPKSPALIDVDDLEEVKSKKPDFIWWDGKNAILVESKFSLRPNNDRALSTPRSCVASWQRTAEAVDQAREFLSENASLLKLTGVRAENWVLVVVTNEHANEATIGFRTLAREAGLLRASGLSGLCLLGASELEDWLAHSSPEQLAREIERVWLATGDSPVVQHLVTRAGRKEAPELPHIAAARKRLFDIEE